LSQNQKEIAIADGKIHLVLDNEKKSDGHMAVDWTIDQNSSHLDQHVGRSAVRFVSIYCPIIIQTRH